MTRDKLAIIAHDGRKADLIARATYNRERLPEVDLVATATTGALLRDKVGLDVEAVLSGARVATPRSQRWSPRATSRR